MATIFDLSFVSRDDETGVANMWAPDRSGNWLEQTTRGKDYAYELVRFMERTNNPIVLLHVIKAMGEIESAPAGGPENGFLCGIGMHLV